MIKFLTETFLFLILIYGITYVLFSFGNGSFDFTTWVKENQEALGTVCTCETIIVLMIQIIRHA